MLTLDLQSRFLSAMLACSVLSAGLLATQPSQFTPPASNTSSQNDSIRVGVPLVNLYASVLDKHNAIVPNLDQSDFKIFENKVEQKIAFFSREKTLPLSIGLLIDISESERARIGAERRAATQFLHSVLREGDKAFLLAFDVDARMLTNWTGDLDLLDRAIQRATIGAGGADQLKPGVFYPNLGGTHLYDTIYVAAVKKMATETARKALIVVTDANDQGSYIPIQHAIEAAQRADVLIHVLVVYNSKHDADFDVAKHLAQETGGRAIDVFNHDRLQKAFDEISEELRSEYSFGYYPTNPKPDGTYRQLKLELVGKSYKVLARKGYYARTAGN